MYVFLWRLGVPVVAMVAGLVGVFPVYVLVLIVPGEVVLPLALLFAGLFAALGATWISNLVAPDRRRTRLLAVVAATEAVAAFLTVLVAALLGTTDAEQLGSVWLLVSTIGLALVASLATWRLRNGVRSLRQDALLSLGLVAVGVLVVVASVSVTCSLVQCVA